ncbi:NAD-dependent epimerase/dehydratase family protein [Rhodococcus opacus]|uniref:NAD-dependent epimerase/dehydratase family protein n=1 Tax=Rhodococcus opacus TaxID=37919 RepID=UPI00294A4D61|nr:NAD(P)-dependent oxidoreductase [Rhodococcus opacus]MDV6246309.1 NAD(P)-dependent oxidoreductase [Rhodococcus opacus]
MRILLTGGLGVNGSWVLRRFIEDGHDVLVVETRDDRSLIPDIADRVNVLVADICDMSAMQKAMSWGPDVVVHMAALVRKDTPPSAMVDVNIGGTAVICEAASDAGVRRVVFASSRAAYGALQGRYSHPDYVPIQEDHPKNPIVLYDIAKVASESIGDWFARERGLEFAALRFATIFGPGKLQRHGGFSTYSSMIELSAAGQKVEIPQGGDERDDLIYVADAAEAVVAVSLAPRPLAHNAYNIGSGTTVPLQALADAVKAAIPEASISIGPGLDPMGAKVSYYGALDSSRAYDEFGWKPKFSLEEAVRHYLAFLGASGM